MPAERDTLIIAAQSSRRIAEEIGGKLGVKLTSLEEKRFNDGEMKLRPLENCSNRHVYLIQSLSHQSGRSTHDKLCELLFLAQTARDAAAARVTAIVPYLCYARQDRQVAWQDPVTTRTVAEVMEAVGIQDVVTMDVHNVSAFQNCFRVPNRNLSAAGILADHLLEWVAGERVVVVSPDIGGVKRSEAFREVLASKVKTGVDQRPFRRRCKRDAGQFAT